MNILGEIEDVALPPWKRALVVGAGGLLLVGLVASGSFYKGWSMRGDREAAVALKAKEAADALLAAERRRGDGLAYELDHEKRNIKTVTVESFKEVPKVTTVYVEVPGEAPKAIPPAVYTNGFVRVWDNSLFAGSVPAATSGADGGAGGADAVRAKLDTPDVLANHVENAGKWAECRAQLRKLIAFEKGRIGNK